MSPYLALLQVRFTRPNVTAGAVSSYLTISPLPRFAVAHRGGVFLWHYLSGFPAWALPSTLPGGARTFLSPNRIGAAAAQSPWPVASVAQPGG